ncbi:MAG: IS630 family transposase [Chloroflexia bacterium]
MEQVLHRPPHRYGIQRSRWRLHDLGRAVSWLNGCSTPGVAKVLYRLGFRYKRARNFIHSPDPQFREKWDKILQAFLHALEHPDTVVFLLADELTYYRQPSLAPAYALTGCTEPRAYQEPRRNTQTRVAAALNGVTGRVTYLQRSKVGEAALISFYAQIRSAYPEAQVIYLVEDNWPTHKLPTVLQAAAEQGLVPLFIPTYASWLNPIEKLWRWLKQEGVLREAPLHLHRWAHDLDQLRRQVCAFLDQFAEGSEVLLRYVGLLSG